MAITPLPQPTLTRVVGAARAEIGAVRGVLPSARASEELVSAVEELQRLKAEVTALEVSLLAELDVREVPRRELGWGSTVDWFTHVSGTTRRQGKRAVTHARRLTGDLAATHRALGAGVVSPDQAAVVVDAVDRLPSGDHVRRRGEQVMIEESGRLNATDLHRAGRHLARVVDPDGEERAVEKALDRDDRAAHLGRFLTVSDDGCGGIRLKGRGTVEDGATLRAALLPLTRPVPTIDPETCEELPDPRDHGARMWHALVEVSRHALDSELPPASHGMRPRIAVTVDHATLHGSTGGVGTTGNGLELADSAVRRLACDCDLVRVLLDADGCVLDVGRDHRLVTPAIWSALVARDCAFPGCSRPPLMCHAHHIVHRIDGGATSLDNMVLLCGHHHRTIHGSPWQVRLAADQRPEFLPPARPGRPARGWTRHRPRLE